MTRIINLTQHAATPDQKEAGVFDLPDIDRKALSDVLTFDDIPTEVEMAARAGSLVATAVVFAADAAMIGGAPYFMRPIEKALHAAGIEPVYAFSRRVSSETIMPDGTVKKDMNFKHMGFVRPYK